MPFRRRTRNPVSRPEKENEGIGAGEPLSPRLIRCQSDNSHRTCSEISLNTSASTDGCISAEAKMSNLMQLNNALIKEIASLRQSHADARDKFSKLETSLSAEKCKLALDVSSVQEEASVLKKENAALLASQEELQASLGTSRAQVEDLSVELAMVKAEVNEAVSTQKQALAASEERLSSATYDLTAVKENAALIISEKDSLFEEIEVALRVKSQMEEKLSAVRKKESELANLLQVEKKAVTDAQETSKMLRKEAEKLFTEKEDLIRKEAARENEVKQSMNHLEESLKGYTTKVDSLTLQIEEERVNHSKAMKSGEEEYTRKLSEALAEIKAVKNHLDESKDKLKESSQKVKAMEDLLQESNASVDALRKQLKEEPAKHQLEVCSLQVKVSDMAVEISSLSAENQKLQAKEQNLHKELSRVNQKQRDASDQLLRERKAVAEAQKALQQEVAQLQVDSGRSLKEVDLLKQEICESSMMKDALLSEKETLLSEKVSLEAKNSSLAANRLKLSKERHDDQRAYAEDKRKLLTQLKEMENMVSDLEIEQSDLLKQLNMEKMAAAAAQDEIATLESRKEGLLRENFDMKATSTEQLSAKEREMSSLCDEVLKLHQLNAKLHEQVTCIQLEKDEVLVKKERVMAQLMRLEVEVRDLSFSKKVLEQNSEEERAKAQGAMSSIRHEIDCLQRSNDQLTSDSISLRSREEAVARDNQRLSRDLTSVQDEKAQLEIRLSDLSAELLEVHDLMEVASLDQAKQQTDIDRLLIEISKLTSANSGLVMSIKMHENQGKLLMSENQKKDEQIDFLSKLSAELEVSHSALEGDIAKQKAAREALKSDNAVLQSSIETKAKALLVLERELDDSAKRVAALESQSESMASKHNVLKLQVKKLQEESVAQNAALDAEKNEKFYLQSTLEEKNIGIQRLQVQLAEALDMVSMLGSQLETSKERQTKLESAESAVKEEIAKANIAAKFLQDQAKENLDCLILEKNSEIGNLKAHLNKVSEHNSDLTAMLKTCNDKKDMLEAQLRTIEAALAMAKGEVLKAERGLIAAAKLEEEFNEASKRISLLEAQLTAKATVQNELEFQVISLQNDLQAARAASANAEKDWKANMEAMRESANARSRGLEEQLESVKKTLDEMQNDANRGQESIASLQTQLSCLREEKASLEKVCLHPRALQAAEGGADLEEEKWEEEMPVKKGLNEKAKFVRFALPVFLISAASSMVIAGIQSYMKKLED